MNVFEDLIVELKQENLLESTVIETDLDDAQVWDDSTVIDPQYDQFESEQLPAVEIPLEELPSEQTELASSFESEPTSYGEVEVAETVSEAQAYVKRKPRNGREFYKKRAIGEVSNLQMVEHVMTGVEREYLKIVPKSFDDFETKKCLNTFLQVSNDENSTEHAESEFALMQETEAWCTSLESRDRNVPVHALRQYCENSRPALSSQALVGLARFYRNLPYSEAVRAKFDFVLTRLLSRPTTDHQRTCLFTRKEMVDHITLLYKEWSSISLYSTDDDESTLMLTVLSFEELADEAESVTNFDLLLTGDFFGRLTMFKESVNELFFAPEVIAAAVESNIRIGNTYIKLIDQERSKMDADAIHLKLQEVDNRVVSDAMARTLEIVDILRAQEERERKAAAPPITVEITEERPVAIPEPVEFDFEEEEVNIDEPQTEKQKFTLNPLKGNALSVNRGFLVVALFLIAVSVGIYVWSNYIIEGNVPSVSVLSVDIEGTILTHHIKTARISGHNFYAKMMPTWEALPKEKREEFIRSVLEYARDKGCTQVTLLNSKGQAVGYASDSKIDVGMF